MTGTNASDNSTDSIAADSHPIRHPHATRSCSYLLHGSLCLAVVTKWAAGSALREQSWEPSLVQGML